MSHLGCGGLGKLEVCEWQGFIFVAETFTSLISPDTVPGLWDAVKVVEEGCGFRVSSAGKDRLIKV